MPLRAAAFHGIPARPSRTMKHGQTSIGIAMDAHLGLDVVAAVPVGRNLQDQAFETHAVVLADRALVLFAQQLIQVPTQEGHEGRTLFPGADGRTPG